MRDAPTDAFAPRPENATSASYQLVRLDDGRQRGTWDRSSLLANLAQYRAEYQPSKSRSDFGQDYYEEHRYQTYLVQLKSFQDSDLESAER